MRAAKVDANQGEIIQALRKAGASVQPLHTVGGGVPDLLCGLPRVSFLVEVKDGAKPPSAQKLTPDQEKWHAAWKGPVFIVRNVEQALQLVAEMKHLSEELSP